MIDYLLLLLVVAVINVIPAFMPPTWIVLAVAYSVNPALNPIALAVGGALASTVGRFFLAKISSTFKDRYLDDRHKDEMKTLGDLAQQNPLKACVAVLLSAFFPFPSNALFIMIGFSEAFTPAIYVGFFLGRAVQYYIAILSSRWVVSSLETVFSLSLVNTIIIDVIALLLLVLFMIIDWKELILKKKIRFIAFSFHAKKQKD